MAEIFILSPEDELLAVLSSDGQDSCNFWDAKYKEELNLGSSFSFIADASHPDARYLFEENQVVFRDKDGELRAFVIKELDDTDDGAEINTLVTCEAAMMELAETIIKEKRPKDKTAQYVLDQVFERTRWTAEVTAELGLNSTSFYKMNALECLSDVLNKWGGEFKDVVEFDGNTITKRTIKVLPRRGKDSGKRFEIDKDTESIRRTVISYPKTALYGYGASLETTDDDGEETGGYSRFIDFADVEWKKSNGDPVDKPKGQEWVGDPALLQKYGRLKNGELIHREDIFSDEDIEDPEELLKATYNHLITVASKTEVNYELSVKLLEGVEGYEHEHVDLGDTTIAIDRNFAIPIETSQRIIVMEYDITDPENTCVVEIGQFLSALQGDDRVKQLQKIIDSNRGTWERKPEAGNVTDGSFPNTKPPRPANIKVEGLYKTISLTWDYDPRSFIAAYEVYASQNKGFTPTAAQLIFRGKTGGWHHQDGVEADQVWYYRLRTINTHGTASDWSEEYEAKTVRILTDDIMFGAVTADKLASLSVTAEKLYTDIENSNILPGSLLRSSDLTAVNNGFLFFKENERSNVVSVMRNSTYNAIGITTNKRKTLRLENGKQYILSFEAKRGLMDNFNYVYVRRITNSNSTESVLIPSPYTDITNYPEEEFVRYDIPFEFTGKTNSDYYILIAGLGGKVPALTVNGVQRGGGVRDIQFLKNMNFAASYNPGEIQVIFGENASFTTPDGTIYKFKKGSTEISTNLEGIGANSTETNAFLMFTGSDNSRFTSGVKVQTYDFRVVRYNGSQWQYNNNDTWVNFTPNSQDTIIGSVARSATTVEGIETLDVTSVSFDIRNVQLRSGSEIKEWSASPFDVMLTEKSITSVHINDAAINSAHISNAAIGSAAIANAAIQKAHLGTAIIDTAHITDGAITNAKIANLSADKITAGTIKGITIEGSIIKGARIEPISQNSRYKSYITANEIYQEYFDGTTNVLTIKEGVFKQSFRDDNKEVVGGTTIDKGFITLEGGSGLSVAGKDTYRFYLFSDFIDGSGFKMTEYNGSTERELFSMVADTIDLTITSNEETIIKSVGTNYYIKGNGQYNEGSWTVSKDGNFTVDVDNGYFYVFAKKGFIINTLDGLGDLNAHTIHMYSGNETKTLLRAAGVWMEDNMNRLQTNCQIIFQSIPIRVSSNIGSHDFTVWSGRNIENMFHVFLQVEGAYSNAIVAGFENKTTSGFRIYLRNVGNSNADNRTYTVNIMMITEAK
ncbi:MULTISPECIES: prophage endopeptidase tail family protein [Bacillus]|uniref:prophage endopeptidase tail family protein n=1 Tax=Bacillus TaxID=1386 RepID=UPI001FCB1095|nr:MULTISPECIES: prophage endopeptidase tail family protein [Bacillus]MCY7581497.1 phage tail protein [Bacillus altitudinis]MCY7594395.1 phage tail protein [Bacillus altitudinis]